MFAIITEVAEESDPSSEGSMISLLDIAVVSTLIGLAFYYLFWRKTEDSMDFQRLNIVPAAKTEDSGLIGKMKTLGKNVVVFYGSQTGTAEEFSGCLAKDALRYGMKGLVMDPEECNMEELSNFSEIENSLAIFCMATYGEGDPTDNAQEFFNLLQQDEIELNGLRYAVFGLGNKTYEHYNAMGIFVDKRLEELGATRIFELGFGDDDANIEEDFLSWRERLWPAIGEYFGIEAVETDISLRQYQLTVHEDLSEEDQYYQGEMFRMGSYTAQKPPYDAKNPFLAPVVVNKELFKNTDRSCMHIEFDISGSKIRYESGDHVAVYPTNNPELVSKIGELLETKLDTIITLTNVEAESNKKHPFPCPTTYRIALLHYVDIMNPVRTHVLKELVEYAKDPKDKEFLEKISSTTPEGKQLYSEWVIKDHRNIIAILEDLSSVKPPLDHLCELLPRLQARYYSISSSPKVHPDRIHITAILIDYVTRDGRKIQGVTTGFLSLKKSSNGDCPRVPIYVRKSQFHLPFKPSTDILMIGPGTGVAPFRAFIQERDFLKSQDKVVGDTILYYGCRNKANDFLYEEELNHFIEQKSLTKLHLAFSRDTAKKVYVQHLLMDNREETWKLLSSGGHIYICGDARNMARDVYDTLISIIMEFAKLPSKPEAVEYMKKIQAKGGYSCDVWS
ncbi:NADPH--cytochrome P450 reductase [Octopus sinensis]|uniref:NADPH--cytochrome P450 reductase n=1 Tax=Octopus sinensis TaxID=2607531 RepID=A0A6P7SH44_9MOLL|nr:NADPH--cytochrome P450 reductase [Octopus sinensis]XP_029637531.1 NADPH--cytochrome P450 reductase [Octopus sinensis]